MILALLVVAPGAIAQPPRIDSLLPSQGPIVGGTSVTIKGANLTGATVKLDRNVIASESQSDSEIRLSMPKHDNGYVVISVITASGAGSREFLYVPPQLDEIPPGSITTVAGVGAFSGDGRLAVRAMVEPTNLAIDGDEIFILEPGQSRIRRVRNDGSIETFAGSGADGFTPDGVVVTDRPLWNPRGIAIDSSGGVLIAESFAHRIRRIDKQTGTITTVAGKNDPAALGGFSGDGGQARLAELSFPSQVATDNGGNLYILDSGNQRIRKVTKDGTITTLAGIGRADFSGDGGPAINAALHFSFVDVGGLAVDSSGNVFVADSDNNRIRKIDQTTGIITTFAIVKNVRAVTTDRNGDVYFASIDLGSPNDPKIFHASATGVVLDRWGAGTGFSDDGAVARSASLGFIDRVKLDSVGNIIFTDFTAQRVRRINRSSGVLETVAGIGPAMIGESGKGVAAVLRNYNGDLAMTADGSLLIADGSARLRSLDRSGIVTTIAGRGLFGLPLQANVRAKDANEVSAVGLSVGNDGSIFFVDLHFVWKIGTNGILQTVAGASGFGFEGDGGPATRALLLQPWAVKQAVDGSLYIADTNNNRIRKVTPDGIINTIAGSGPPNGFENYGRGVTCGDGGPALSACINTPYGVAVDTAGNVYISENWGHIRKLTVDGHIATVANVYSTKLVFDTAENLYGVSGDGVVRILADGRVIRIAGSRNPTTSLGDGGPATDASVLAQGQASGLAIDRDGNIFFSDGGHLRVRAIRYGAVLAPPAATIQASSNGSTIQTKVFDETSRPAPGVRVDFTAPTSGASCALSRPFAITDVNGIASVSCTPNCAGGTYSVTARPLAASSFANVSFTNVAGPCRRRSVHH